MLERQAEKSLSSIRRSAYEIHSLVDGDHDVGGLDDGDGLLALGQTEFLDGGVGDGAGNAHAVLILDGHMPVDGAFLDGDDGTLDLIARGKAGDALGGEHDVGGLDHGVAFLAFGQAKLLDGRHGDVGGDGIMVAAADDDDRVDGAFLDGLDGALDLVACRDLHVRSFPGRPSRRPDLSQMRPFAAPPF